MIRFAADIDRGRRAIWSAGAARRLSRRQFDLFTLLYEADLVDGEWRSAAWLGRRLYARAKRPGAAALCQLVRRLRSRLAGSRFAIESRRREGYRLIVEPIASPPVVSPAMVRPPPIDDLAAAAGRKGDLLSLVLLGDAALRLHLLLGHTDSRLIAQILRLALDP